MAEKRDILFETRFKESILLKMKSDLKSRFFKHHAAKYLYDTFGESLEDDGFLRWLAKNLDYKTYRLKSLIANYKNQQKARHSRSLEKLQTIYNYWLDEEVSIPTTDDRAGRNEKRIGKLRYLTDFKHLTLLKDDEVTEKIVTLKKKQVKQKLTFVPIVKFTRNPFVSFSRILIREIQPGSVHFLPFINIVHFTLALQWNEKRNLAYVSSVKIHTFC